MAELEEFILNILETFQLAFLSPNNKTLEKVAADKDAIPIQVEHSDLMTKDF